MFEHAVWLFIFDGITGNYESTKENIEENISPNDSNVKLFTNVSTALLPLLGFDEEAPIFVSQST